MEKQNCLKITFATPQSPALRKTEENTTQGSNQRLLHPEPIQRSGIKHSVGKVIPHSNLGRQEAPCEFGHSTP